MAGEQAHQQASRGTAITHVEGLLRLHESAHTYASNMPDALRIPVDIGAHGPHGLSRRDHILALQQARSEEHTSELQSLMRISYAVFCLKKKIHTHINTTITTRNKHPT